MYKQAATILLFLTFLPFILNWISRDCEIFDEVIARQVFPFRLEFVKYGTFGTCDLKVTDRLDIKDDEGRLNGLLLFTMIIKPGALSHLTNLKYLFVDLYRNNNIQNGAFVGLKSLESFEIRYGHTIQERAFEGLENVKKLQIDETPIKAIGQFLFSNLTSVRMFEYTTSSITNICDVLCRIQNLTHVRHLNLFNNLIESINKNCTSATGNSERAIHCGHKLNITHLTLRRNPLYKIEVSSLHYCKHLVLLNVDESHTNMSELLESGIKTVAKLSMSHMEGMQNEIVENACYVAFSFKTSSLILRKNAIKKIDVKSIQKCKLIKALDLGENQINTTEPGYLYTMRKLRSLLLSMNYIKTINMCPTNQTFTASVTHLDLSSNLITALNSRQFSCMAQLLHLKLENNKITVIKNGAFSELTLLSKLNLNKNCIFEIEEYHFKNLQNLSVLSMKNNCIKKFHRRSFKVLTNVQELHLCLSRDLSEVSELPPTINILSLKWKNEINICKIDITYIASLKHLYLDGCKVNQYQGKESSLPALKELHLKRYGDSDLLHLLPNLESLHLESNVKSYKIVNLSSLNTLTSLYMSNIHFRERDLFERYDSFFQNLTNVEILVLKQSGFIYFTQNMFKDLQSLKYLLVQSQKIITTETNLFYNSINLRYVCFDDVIFQCDCQTAWIISWAATQQAVVLNVFKHECVKWYNKENLIHFLEWTCNLPQEFYFFVGTTVFNLLFMAGVFLYTMVGWYVIYFFQIIKIQLNGLIDWRERKSKYNYDVFVSYSTKDEFWVVSELLPNLEQKGPPFLKLCLHNRDFEVGKDIVDNIVDSIYSSRKTICVITHHYLRSEWCSLEMRMVTYRLLAESQDRLILVFLERICTHEISVYHRLAKVIKKKTYIEWPERENEQVLFWERLKLAVLKSEHKSEI